MPFHCSLWSKLPKISRESEADEADISEVTDKCGFGYCLNDNCHRNFKPEMIQFCDMLEKDQHLLKWRAGLIFVMLYENHVRVKGGHVILISEVALSLKNKGWHVIPGWQLCRTCYEKVKITVHLTLNVLMIMVT